MESPVDDNIASDFQSKRSLGHFLNGRFDFDLTVDINQTEENPVNVITDVAHASYKAIAHIVSAHVGYSNNVGTLAELSSGPIVTPRPCSWLHLVHQAVYTMQ